jgi:uncharacterized membrane protein YczE
VTTSARAVPARSSRDLWRPDARRLARLLLGLWLFGTGDALIVDAVLGNAPWTVLAQGVSLRTPVTIGIATQLIGVVVLCGWIPLRERPGLGTVLNVVVIGVALDVMLPLLPDPVGLVARWAGLLAGVGLVGLGSGFYLTARLGPGPRDGLMTGIHRRRAWPLGAVRAGIEFTVLTLGWALGGTVGLGTVAFAVLIGPAVGLGVRLLGGAPRAAGAPRA